MTIVPFVAIAAATGILSLGLRASRTWSTGIAFVGLVAMTLAAARIDPASTIVAGGLTLGASEWLRLFALLGSVVALLLVVIDVAAMHEPDAPGVLTLGIGAGVLALSVSDAGTAVVAATAGGLAGVLVAAPVGAAARAAFVGARELRALAIAGALAIVATAWIARPLGALALVPDVFGLAYLAFAAAVAIRLGAIPFHLWAARVADAAPGVALPLLLAWGPAAFATVCLGWIDSSIAPLPLPIGGEQALVAVIGVLSVVLGVLAAAVQDDLEHVVGYTIAADAGFVVLALAGFDPGIWEPSRIWLLVFVVGRSAFAAWAVAIHGAFGTRRIPELAGWARRTPVLAAALIAIAAVAIGWPGLGAWEARAAIASSALADPVAALVSVVPLASIAIYGRLLLVGLRPLGPVATAGRSDRPGWPVPWPRRPMGGLTTTERMVERSSHAVAAALDVLWTIPTAVRLNRTVISSVAVLVLAGLAASVASGGLGVPDAARAAPVVREPGPSSQPSAEPSGSPGAEPTPGFSFEPIGS